MTKHLKCRTYWCRSNFNNRCESLEGALGCYQRTIKKDDKIDDTCFRGRVIHEETDNEHNEVFLCVDVNHP